MKSIITVEQQPTEIQPETKIETYQEFDKDLFLAWQSNFLINHVVHECKIIFTK